MKGRSHAATVDARRSGGAFRARNRRGLSRLLSWLGILGWLATGCGASATPTGEADRRAAIQVMFDKVKDRYAEVPVIDRAGVAALEERAVLVDVRPPEERAVSTIAGALDVAAFRALPADPERVVVTYCTIGERSGRFARDLRETGIDARNLTGGILEWTFAGGELIDPAGRPTKRAHVYGPRWNLLPEGWTGVYGD